MPLRLWLALAALLLTGASVLHEAAEARGRREVERFLASFALDRRRPDLAATARVEGSADLAMQVAVRATVLDLAGSASIGKLDPELRTLWLRSVDRLPEEEAAARGLALRSVASRPAWAFGAEALAELVLAGEWREPPAERRVERWQRPLAHAVLWAPSEPLIRSIWAASLLERWPALDEEARRDGENVVRTALVDDRFVAQSLPAVAATLGVEKTLALLPDSAKLLAIARQAMAGSGFEVAVRLHERWEAAERVERKAAVERISTFLSSERLDRAAEAGRTFLQEHPVEVFDDAQGWEEARLVLKAVADGRHGAWSSDPRGALIRYFLAAPERLEPGPALLNAASGLMGIPEPVRARLFLAGGDTYGWRKLFDDAEGSLSSQWIPFLTDLARRLLAAEDPVGAEAVVRRIPRHSAAECEVVLVRREVARVREDAAALSALAALHDEAFPESISTKSWPANGGAGTLGVCVDPERDSGRELVVRVKSPAPSLQWWGWDGGRRGTVLVDGEKTLTFPLEGLAGQRTFAMGPLTGAGVTLLEARIASAAGQKKS